MASSLLDRLRKGFASRPKHSRLPPRRLHRFPVATSLVGAVLGAAGALCLVEAVTDFRASREARAWQEAQCRVEVVSLKKSAKFYSSLRGRYSYVWAGRRYTGKRFTTIGASPDVYAQQARLKRLEAARAAGRSVRCFVDPADPTQAVVDRELSRRERVIHPLERSAMGFFGLALAAHLAWGFLGALRSRMRWRKAARSGRPWEANDEWRRLECHPVLPFRMLDGVTRVGLALWVGAFMALGLPGGLWLIGAIGIPLAIFFLPRRAIHRTLQRSASGPLALRLAEAPFHPGGLLRAELVCRAPAVVGDEMVFRLLCSRECESGSRYSAGYHRYDDAELETRVPRSQWSVASSEVRIPVEIAIPAKLPGWGHRPRNGEEVYWQLEAWGGDVRGVDFGALFDVPVFDEALRSDSADRG